MTFKPPFEKYLGLWIQDSYRWHFVYRFLGASMAVNFFTVRNPLEGRYSTDPRMDKGYYGLWSFNYESPDLYYLPEEKDFHTVMRTIFSGKEE
jgi:hypothetical protein